MIAWYDDVVASAGLAIASATIAMAIAEEAAKNRPPGRSMARDHLAAIAETDTGNSRLRIERDQADIVRAMKMRDRQVAFAGAGSSIQW